MNQPKKHHLLPQFYLRGFCNPEVHAREDHDREPSRCAVWVHDKQEDLVRQRGAKNLSVESHYYSAVTMDGPDAKPETVLAGIEDRAARVIRDLRIGHALRPEQKARLALFMASMKFRVSSYRPFGREHVEVNGARIKQSAFPSVEQFRQDLQDAGLPEGDDPELVERVFREIHSGEREIPLTKNTQIQHMFEHTVKVARRLLDFDWTFVWAPARASFVTSDDPVLILDPNLRAPASFFGDLGFATRGTTKVLPLNQDVCLLIGTEAHTESHGHIDRAAVRHLNLQQTRHYDRWLIARDEALVSSFVPNDVSRNLE